MPVVELARANISAPAFYLLRPDGHVGLCGTSLDAAAVARYFADHHFCFDATAHRAIDLPLQGA